MSKKKFAAVEKAKRQGAKKLFYITGPAGWPLAEILPRIDMVTRLYTELFAEQKISQMLHSELKDAFYSYLEGIDEWVSINAETLLQAGLLNNAGSDYLRLYKHGIKKKKTVYLNTQLALNAFYSFAKCDALSALLVIGLRRDAISPGTYKKSACDILGLIENFKEDIQGKRDLICEFPN